MLNKKITLRFTIKYIITILALTLILGGTVYFITHQDIKNRTKKNYDITNSQKNNPFSVQGKKMSFEEWRKQPGNLSIEEAKDKTKVAFEIKFPKNETLTGKLEVINGVGQYNGKSIATDILMMFSKGIKIKQILPDPDEAKALSDYADYITTDKLTKRDFKKVEINGVDGWASEPKVQDTWGEAHKSPGSVSWFKDGIYYAVTGNGNLPLEQLLEVAKLFD